jgi:hypothetical protein
MRQMEQPISPTVGMIRQRRAGSARRSVLLSLQAGIMPRPCFGPAARGQREPLPLHLWQ